MQFNQNGKNGKKSNQSKLSPQSIAVIVGLLTNALDVESVLVDKNKNVQIVLSGSFRKKTKADLIVDELGDVNVRELLAAFLRK